MIALNDAIADGQDVSWIWDVDFEPLLAGVERLVASGGRAAELALRFKYGGLATRRRSRWSPSSSARSTAGSRSTPPGGELVVLPTYTAMLALRRIVAERGLRSDLLGARRMRIRVGHLYPDYLNIYADRGNIAVLDAARGAGEGTSSTSRRSSVGDEVRPGEIDLFYVGGGQDREQALIAPDLAAKGAGARARRSAGGAALLAVCGGYQLLGRFYLDRHGVEQPGVGLFPHETVAGERRMIGDVLLECELEPGERRTLAGFENHAGRTRLDPGAEPLGRVVAGFGNDGESGFEGCRVGRAIGTYLHGPLLPRNPWLADWLLAQALAHATRRRAAGARAARGRARARGARRLVAARAGARRPFLTAVVVDGDVGVSGRRHTVTRRDQEATERVTDRL